MARRNQTHPQTTGCPSVDDGGDSGCISLVEALSIGAVARRQECQPSATEFCRAMRLAVLSKDRHAVSKAITSMSMSTEDAVGALSARRDEAELLQWYMAAVRDDAIIETLYFVCMLPVDIIAQLHDDLHREANRAVLQLTCSRWRLLVTNLAYASKVRGGSASGGSSKPASGSGAVAAACKSSAAAMAACIAGAWERPQSALRVAADIGIALEKRPPGTKVLQRLLFDSPTRAAATGFLQAAWTGNTRMLSSMLQWRDDTIAKVASRMCRCAMNRGQGAIVHVLLGAVADATLLRELVFYTVLSRCSEDLSHAAIVAIKRCSHPKELYLAAARHAIRQRRSMRVITVIRECGQDDVIKECIEMLMCQVSDIALHALNWSRLPATALSYALCSAAHWGKLKALAALLKHDGVCNVEGTLRDLIKQWSDARRAQRSVASTEAVVEAIVAEYTPADSSLATWYGEYGVFVAQARAHRCQRTVLLQMVPHLQHVQFWITSMVTQYVWWENIERLRELQDINSAHPQAYKNGVRNAFAYWYATSASIYDIADRVIAVCINNGGALHYAHPLLLRAAQERRLMYVDRTKTVGCNTYFKHQKNERFLIQGPWRGMTYAVEDTSLLNLAFGPAMEMMRFRKGHADRQVPDDPCVICLEDLTSMPTTQLPCDGRHIVHTECCLRWIDTGKYKTCPYCSQVIWEQLQYTRQL